MTTLVKIYRQSSLTFSHFSNLETIFHLLDKELRERKIFLPYSNYTLNTERLTSHLNLSEEEENNEINFIEIKPESTIVSIKQINLSSKVFFEKFFYPINSKDNFSYPKFHESLNDHYNIDSFEFKKLNSDNKKE